MSDFLLLAGQLALIAAIAGAVSYALIAILGPFLARYALAQPNARSSHKEATPQGGGIAVIGAVIAVTGGVCLAIPELMNEPRRLAAIMGAVIVLVFVGAIDDVRPLGPTSRLLLQIAAAILVVAAIPTELRPINFLPWWLERALILLACVWFINLVNFMDGIDWMTVAEVVPLTAGLVFFGLIGELPTTATVIAAALFGAIIGFAPSNRPVARLFLGDVGSLPVALMLAWMLVLLAVNGHLVAAFLMPLYYLADATLTLVWRIAKGRPVAQAHRDHFYQRAIDGGRGIYRVIGPVFAVNIVLVALAASSVNSSTAYQLLLIALGLAIVGALLWSLADPKRSKQ
ncbi:MAG TPA: glycosyl transferase [Pseudolabrys sp.]|jgi:UDP-N-acetylmuramyl pentapeptide phosphotransferase/UDP-N-acetylglucosamine-1-phosphate transferase|nr:glycosyl transferase [Pseudolabrys sp.]